MFPVVPGGGYYLVYVVWCASVRSEIHPVNACLRQAADTIRILVGKREIL